LGDMEVLMGRLNGPNLLPRHGGSHLIWLFIWENDSSIRLCNMN
jgi:hypothetical protein